jgi:hypothetical protein
MMLAMSRRGVQMKDGRGWITRKIPEIVTENRGEGVFRVPEKHWSCPNDKRVSGTERYRGWLRGKGSGGQNPMGGCGAKQNHKAQAGSKPLRG